MNIERREAAPPAYERRIISLPGDLRAELRDAAGDAAARRLVGHAAVFDNWTTLHESASFLWKEVVRPGAFRAALLEEQDVRALWNHDANIVLGRTASGTLALSEDALGLLSAIDPPDTQMVRDMVLAPIARGDVDQMSFAFGVRRSAEPKITSIDGATVADYGGERVTVRRDGVRMIEERELISLNLFDVSPVTNPAYEATDVALRKRALDRESEVRALVLAEERVRKSGQRERMRMRLKLAEAR